MIEDQNPFSMTPQIKIKTHKRYFSQKNQTSQDAPEFLLHLPKLKISQNQNILQQQQQSPSKQQLSPTGRRRQQTQSPTSPSRSSTNKHKKTFSQMRFEKIEKLFESNQLRFLKKISIRNLQSQDWLKENERQNKNEYEKILQNLQDKAMPTIQINFNKKSKLKEKLFKKLEVQQKDEFFARGALTERKYSQQDQQEIQKIYLNKIPKTVGLKNIISGDAPKEFSNTFYVPQQHVIYDKLMENSKLKNRPSDKELKQQSDLDKLQLRTPQNKKNKLIANESFFQRICQNQQQRNSIDSTISTQSEMKLPKPCFIRTLQKKKYSDDNILSQLATTAETVKNSQFKKYQLNKQQYYDEEEHKEQQQQQDMEQQLEAVDQNNFNQVIAYDNINFFKFKPQVPTFRNIIFRKINWNQNQDAIKQPWY